MDYTRHEQHYGPEESHEVRLERKHANLNFATWTRLNKLALPRESWNDTIFRLILVASELAQFAREKGPLAFQTLLFDTADLEDLAFFMTIPANSRNTPEGGQ